MAIVLWRLEWLYFLYLELETWFPLWMERLEKVEKLALEYDVIFENGLEKLENDIIFKTVGLEKLGFHLWTRNIFTRCFPCMLFVYFVSHVCYLWCMSFLHFHFGKPKLYQSTNVDYFGWLGTFLQYLSVIFLY